MAKLVKQIPALVATTKEIALPKLNTFWRYAKVGSLIDRHDDFIFISSG